MTKLNYRCPHCLQRVEVEIGTVGQVNLCNECGMPYQPEVPTGRLMRQRADGGWSVVGEAITGQRSPDEKTVMMVHPAMFRARPLRYVGLILTVIVGFAGMLYFGVPVEGSAVDRWWRPITIVISILSGICGGVALISMVYWFVRTRYDCLTITNERTVWARGILDRETSEVQHDDIRNIQTKQTLVDRILGVGRIAISSAGQDEMEIDIRDVPAPDQVAETVRSYQARMQGRGD